MIVSLRELDSVSNNVWASCQDKLVVFILHHVALIDEVLNELGGVFVLIIQLLHVLKVLLQLNDLLLLLANLNLSVTALDFNQLLHLFLCLHVSLCSPSLRASLKHVNADSFGSYTRE